MNVLERLSLLWFGYMVESMRSRQNYLKATQIVDSHQKWKGKKTKRAKEKWKRKRKKERGKRQRLYTDKSWVSLFWYWKQKRNIVSFPKRVWGNKERRYLVGGTKSMSLHLWQCGVSNQLILVLSGWLQRSVFFRWLLWCLFSWGCIFDFLWGL